MRHDPVYIFIYNLRTEKYICLYLYSFILVVENRCARIEELILASQSSYHPFCYMIYIRRLHFFLLLAKTFYDLGDYYIL